MPLDPSFLKSVTFQPSPEAAGLLAHLERTGDVPRQTLEQLCALALSDDPAAARAGADAIFHEIVEPLGDRFEPAACERYVRLFSGVIEACRRHPALESFDRLLCGFGLKTAQDIVRRAERVRTPEPVAPGPLKAVLVPSRVTLGADIAVTSVMLARLKTLFPDAKIKLLGSAKAGALFASDSRIELLETKYARGGMLRERLEAWVALCGSIASHIAGLEPHEYLVVDPDSRLTQLGLLPLVPADSRYRFFESRSYAAAGATALGGLTNRWMSDVFSEGDVLPFVALPEQDMQRGRGLREKLPGKIAAVNLGVGENPEKRVEDPFELEMLRVLIQAGYALILDRGAGDEELARTTRLVNALKRDGNRAAPFADAPAGSNVLIWDGSLSGFGGLIAAADLYVGYDSAGGHLAAALGTPAVDVFTTAAPARMRERWTPSGRAPVRVLTARRSEPDEALRQLRAALAE